MAETPSGWPSKTNVHTLEEWVLQAKSDKDLGWVTLGGFAYQTREELQAAYDKNLKKLHGTPSTGGERLEFRFMHLTQTITDQKDFFDPLEFSKEPLPADDMIPVRRGDLERLLAESKATPAWQNVSRAVRESGDGVLHQTAAGTEAPPDTQPQDE